MAVILLSPLILILIGSGFLFLATYDVTDYLEDAATTAYGEVKYHLGQTAEATLPHGRIEVRFISNEWLCIVGDYSDFFNERVLAEQKFRLPEIASAPNADDMKQFNYAVFEIMSRYRPTLVQKWNEKDFIRIRQYDGGNLGVLTSNSWISSIGQFRIKQKGLEKLTAFPAVAHFVYVKLAEPMRDGMEYTVETALNERISFTWREKERISQSIKVNQVGYHPDAGQKYAYLNMWLGPGMSLDVEKYEGQEFSILRDNDRKEMYCGKIKFRSVERYHSVQGKRIPVNGGSVMEMDFSDFRVPGKYHIRVPGIGRSWSFQIGNETIGEEFFAHARGLYHARCGVSKERPYTNWELRRCHLETKQGGFSPMTEEYHSKAYMSKDDKTKQFNHFKIVAETATGNVLPGVLGGWHDAADFDRRTLHLQAVAQLLGSFLLFPDNYSDGQLNIPESGNGIPDIIDEAVWGLNVFRKAQNVNGSVGTWIEATSHPKNWNPETDMQQYYLSLATRASSAEYASVAALLARIFHKIGQETESILWRNSAFAAFRFAANPSNTVSFQSASANYKESEKPQSALLFKAALNLSALYDEHTEISSEFAEFLSPECAEEYYKLAPYPRSAFYHAEMVETDPVPAARPYIKKYSRMLMNHASIILARQESNAFRHTHYSPDHPFFRSLGFGNANPLRYAQTLILAWKSSGEQKYRDAAFLANDFLMGANPMGRSMTTGLGTVYPVRILHLPTHAKGWSEPPPGITPFSFIFQVNENAKKLLFTMDMENQRDKAPRSFYSVMIPQLPQNATKKSVDDFLDSYYPVWHRSDTLEHYSVNISEFSVWETISESAAVTGALLTPNWKPDPSLLDKKPIQNVENAPGYLVQP